MINIIQKLVLLTLLLVSLLYFNSCKIINIHQDLRLSVIPDNIELIKIPQGNYTSGKNNIEKIISYDYSIMKYPVTNRDYADFLIGSMENGNIIVNSDSIMGYYHGDKNWTSGYYLFLDLDDPDCRILFFPPNIFAIPRVYLGPHNNDNETYENHPVTEVTWFGANAFAKYYGLSLPTVEEWEKAARANLGFNYSWGNDLDSLRVNYYNSGDKFDNNTTPVGYFNGSNNTIDSPSPYGLYDMTGNVWEWTASWQGESPGKILKGGSWYTKSQVYYNDKLKFFSELYTWFNHPVNGFSPINSSHDIGFRCVER